MREYVLSGLTGILFFAAGIGAATAEGLGQKINRQNHGEGVERDLGLSEEIVPYRELGDDVDERPRLLTEVIEDAIFPSNRERQKMLEERAPDEPGGEIPERKTLFGGADRFLSPGPTSEGIEAPGGAVWRPYWVIYGQVRSAFQGSDPAGRAKTVEWANRLDLLADYYLTATERFHVSFRPLDEEGEFSGYTFEGEREGWNDGLNFEPRTLFFEGEVGEIFPGLDQNDRFSLDYGFSVGRQPLSFQDGIMVNDVLDGIGVARNNMFLFGSSSTRLSAFWAPGQVHRNDNLLDKKAQLFAVFSQHDFDKATLEADVAYVKGGSRAGDGFYGGIGHIRRFGYWNSTFRANASWALGGESAAVSSGYLLTHELSRTMRHSDDIVYLNTFWGIGDYASAARDPAVGGPLGRMGLLYQAVGLGTYGAPLGNRPNDSAGFSLGYQHFFGGGEFDRQLIAEFGGRTPTEGPGLAELGFGLRYQQALNKHVIFVLDGYVTHNEDNETGYGARSEIRVKY